MQQRQYYPTFIVTPHGIMMDDMPLAKSARKNLPTQTLRSITRMEELLTKVKKEDWDNRTPHAMNDAPILAQAKMIAALNSPQPFPLLHKHDERPLYNTDWHYTLLKRGNIDFITQIAKGRTLFVGEGNLSFALSLIRSKKITPGNLVATTFEKEADWTPDTVKNAAALRALGVKVLGGIDATGLRSVFGNYLFDNIVFQFPNVGSREPVEGRNPNFILVRDFLAAARTQLMPGGKVLISAVDSPYYQGSFHFEEAADLSGFASPEVYAFAPNVFSGYEHAMTHQNGSALDNHDTFSTWIFRAK